MNSSCLFLMPHLGLGPKYLLGHVCVCVCVWWGGWWGGGGGRAWGSVCVGGESVCVGGGYGGHGVVCVYGVGGGA